MKDKRLEQLEKMLEDRRWDLLYCLNSGRGYNREVELLSDEMEMIIEKIKERGNLWKLLKKKHSHMLKKK